MLEVEIAGLKETNKLIRTEQDLTYERMQSEIDTLGSRYSQVIDRNSMVAEDIRSEAFRLFNLNASKDALIKKLYQKI